MLPAIAEGRPATGREVVFLELPSDTTGNGSSPRTQYASPHSFQRNVCKNTFPFKSWTLRALPLHTRMRVNTPVEIHPEAILLFMRAATELFSRPCCRILARLGASQNTGRSQHRRYRCEAVNPLGVAKRTSTRMIYGFNEGSTQCLGTYYSCQ